MRTLTFTKRNILEYLRNPLSLFFTLVFPIAMFFIFQLIKFGTGATDDLVPMFAINNLIPSIAIFSITFIALTSSLQISKDRETSFQARLYVSPMKPANFFFGYFIPCLIIAIMQIIISFILGFCFGLKFNVNLILCFFALLFISVFYISIGILVGSVFPEKVCGGIGSLLVNITAVFSGMFFPLTTGTFRTILSYLPFLPSVEIGQLIIKGSTVDLLKDFIVISIYMLISIILSILSFRKRRIGN